MKMLIISILMIAGTLICSQLANAQTNTVIIEVSNIMSVKGDLYLGFFKEGTKFPGGEQIFKTQVITGGKSQVTITVPKVPSGVYAFMIYQDTNANAKFDRNLIGIPKEPYALSQNFHPRMSAPKFEQCEVTIAPGSTTFSLVMIN